MGKAMPGKSSLSFNQLPFSVNNLSRAAGGSADRAIAAKIQNRK
jgi:hypothetical protein